jgi:hypothetical protein
MSEASDYVENQILNCYFLQLTQRKAMKVQAVVRKLAEMGIPVLLLPTSLVQQAAQEAVFPVTLT